MQMSKKLMMLSALTLSLTLASQAKAFDPISVVGIVASPIFCKMINCKNETTNYLFAEDPVGSRKRLGEMRDKFDWALFSEDLYEEGECTEFFTDIAINNQNRGTACYMKGEWVIQPHDNQCDKDPFKESCFVSSLR